jgi:hypothetical protein
MRARSTSVSSRTQATSYLGHGDVVQQYLATGLLDEFELNVVRVLLGSEGGGRRAASRLRPRLKRLQVPAGRRRRPSARDGDRAYDSVVGEDGIVFQASSHGGAGLRSDVASR